MTDEFNAVTEDQPRNRRNVYLAVGAVVIALTFASGVVLHAVMTNNEAATNAESIAKELRHEAEVRRDQTCVLFERNHHQAVARVKRTYDYLKGLTKQQRNDPLNRAVIAQLPDTETDARNSAAPRYCNVRGVGLPEPPPELPQRPSAVD